MLSESMAAAGTRKKDSLLIDDNIRCWYDNMYVSSKHTAEVVIRRLTVRTSK